MERKSLQTLESTGLGDENGCGDRDQEAESKHGLFPIVAKARIRRHWTEKDEHTPSSSKVRRDTQRFERALEPIPTDPLGKNSSCCPRLSPSACADLGSGAGRADSENSRAADQ